MFVLKACNAIPPNLEEHFRDNSRRQFNNEHFRQVKISKNYIGNIDGSPCFSGSIYFKKKIKDFDYTISNLSEVEREDKSTFVSDKVDFIILQEQRLAIFFSREDALPFGSNILSQVLFDDSNKLKPITFDCTGIFKNKGRENITDVTFNGVRGAGKITAQGQWRSDIDHDAQFLDVDDRYGIGFVWNDTQITIYESGSIRFRRNVKDFVDQTRLRMSILNKFLPYSNYSSIR